MRIPIESSTSYRGRNARPNWLILAAFIGTALAAGALGCSISGAGPALFAWCLEDQAAAVSEAMVQEFQRHGLKADHWITEIAPTGARVID